MLQQYIYFLLEKAEYEKDESGMYVGIVPGYQGCHSHGSNWEEARRNLEDAIQLVIATKLAHNNPEITNDLQGFISAHFHIYA